MSLREKLESWLNFEYPRSSFPICDYEKLSYDLRPGDVLLVEGRTRIADVIRVVTQSRWSHSAIYIGRLHDIYDQSFRDKLLAYYPASPDSQLLIEGILGQGMIVTLLSDYAGENLRVCRPSTLSNKDAQHVINYCIDKLGIAYNFRQLFDVARFIFPWRILPRRWRSTLFSGQANDTTKTVCSAMIAEAFYSVHYPILPLFRKQGNEDIELIPRNTRLYTPADFDYSPYFDIKKYAFMGSEDATPYRDLPWNKDGLVGNTDKDFDTYESD